MGLEKLSISVAPLQFLANKKLRYWLLSERDNGLCRKELFFLLDHIVLYPRTHKHRKHIERHILSIDQVHVLGVYEVDVLVGQLLLENAFPSVLVAIVVKVHFVQVRLHLVFVALINALVGGGDDAALLAHVEDV